MHSATSEAEMPSAAFDSRAYCRTLHGFQGLSSLIGRTPLLAVHFLFRGEQRTIFAKAEHYNFTGSIKDRMALNILRCGYASGALKPGDLIAEATSGNTGIAIAAAGRALGHPVRIYMPDWMSNERKQLLESLGAELVLISKEDNGFLGAIARTKELAQSRADVFLPRQFSNQDNCQAHYDGIGPEIIKQLGSIGRVPDAFVAGVGTGGTIMGVGRALKAVNSQAKVHPLEPAESPTLSTGHKVGSHRIQGISDDFIPDIVDLGSIDHVISVNDGDAILMAQKLAQELGLGVGISSGANFIGALKAQNKLTSDAGVVTIFCDDNKKYLSTDLARSEPLKSDYFTPHIDLLGFEAIAYH